MQKKPGRTRAKKVLTKTGWIIIIIVVLMPFITALYGLITQGSWPPWTGFGNFTDPNGDFYRVKTLWDLMQLLLIPLILSLGAIWFNRKERKADREIAARYSSESQNA